MRKIAATYVFPGNRPPVRNGILLCDDDGTIIDLIEKGENLREEHGVEFYSGILVPGFVNAHCHIEFSHLLGKIEEKKGIGGFVKGINQLRNEEAEIIEKAIEVYDRKMWAAGIAAVGDVTNSETAIPAKRKSRIKYHTFVESFGFHPSRAEKSFGYAMKVYEEHIENGLPASLVPHSPYSVSEPLFEKIRAAAQPGESILTIHNQESRAERQFYEEGTGAIADHLQHNLGIDISHWKPTGKSSLLSVLKYFPEENPLLLVHNTFTQKDDLDGLRERRSMKNTYFVLCPNSNLYIEDRLPPVGLFREEHLNLCLGTDSLASNHRLSVLAEMITLQDAFPDLEIEELVQWACVNGAKALGMEDRFGSFEKGKKPGVNLVSGIDFKNMKLTSASKVKRLL